MKITQLRADQELNYDISSAKLYNYEREQYSMINPALDKGKQIDQYLRSIAQKVLPGRDISDLCFTLSKDRIINAFYIKDDEQKIPQTISITEGMINYIKTEDELVCLIAHELGHRYANKKKEGLDDKSNSVSEEFFSDIWLMDQIIKGGWNPEGAYSLMTRLSSGGSGLIGLFDVHGSPGDRIAIIEESLTYIKNKNGSMPESRSTEFGDLFNDCELSFKIQAIFNQKISSDGYQELQIEEKIREICELCKDFIEQHGHSLGAKIIIEYMDDLIEKNFDSISEEVVSNYANLKLNIDGGERVILEKRYKIKKNKLIGDFDMKSYPNLIQECEDNNISVGGVLKDIMSRRGSLKDIGRLDIGQIFEILEKTNYDFNTLKEIKKELLNEKAIEEVFNYVNQNIESITSKGQQLIVPLIIDQINKKEEDWEEELRILTQINKHHPINAGLFLGLRRLLFDIGFTNKFKKDIEGIIKDQSINILDSIVKDFDFIQMCSIKVLVLVGKNDEKKDTDFSQIVINIEENDLEKMSIFLHKNQLVKEFNILNHLGLPLKKITQFSSKIETYIRSCQILVEKQEGRELLTKLLSNYQTLFLEDKNSLEFIVNHRCEHIDFVGKDTYLRKHFFHLYEKISPYLDLSQKIRLENNLLFDKLYLDDLCENSTFKYEIFNDQSFIQRHLSSGDSGSKDEDEDPIDLENQNIDGVMKIIRNYYDNDLSENNLDLKDEFKEILLLIKSLKRSSFTINIVLLQSILEKNNYIKSSKKVNYIDSMLNRDHEKGGFNLKNEGFKNILSKKLLQTNLDRYSSQELLDFILVVNNLGLFSDNLIAYHHFISLFIDKISSENQLSEGTNKIIKLLEGEYISEPKLRNDILGYLTNNLTEIIQKNIEGFKKCVTRIRNINIVYKYDILKKLCYNLKTQEEDSLFAKGIIDGDAKSIANIKTLNEIIFENQKFFTLINQTNSTSDVLDFIMSEGSTDDIDYLALKLSIEALNTMDNVWEKIENTMRKDIKQRTESIELQKKLRLLLDKGDYEGAKKILKGSRKGSIAYKNTFEYAKLYYKNFRTSSFEMRAVYLNHLVNNATNENNEFGHVKMAQQHIEKMCFDKINNKILPKNSKYSKEVKAIFYSYYRCLQDYEKNLFLSSIIAGSERTKNKKNINGDIELGKLLGYLFEHLGPAEVKFGQAMHSHPSTPESIGEQLKYLKSKVDLPAMWEIWGMIKNKSIVPSNISNNIEEIIDVHGGSINVAIHYKGNKGERILSLQKLNAEARIKSGFAMIENTINDIDNSFYSLKDSSKDILETAHQVALDETNIDLYEKQYELAGDLYNGKAIMFGGDEYILNTPQLDQFGIGYKDMNYLNGLHFNELEEKDKSKFAGIILFMELGLDFNGFATDKDRHGDNIRINTKENIINHFDFGGINTETVSNEQIAALGTIIIHLIKSLSESSTKNVNVNQIISQAIKNLKLKNNHKLIAGIEQRLLSLGDYLKFVSQSEIMDIAMSIASNGVHPIIEKQIKEELGFDLSSMSFGSYKLIASESRTKIKPQRIDPQNTEKRFDPIPLLMESISPHTAQQSAP